MNSQLLIVSLSLLFASTLSLSLGPLRKTGRVQTSTRGWSVKSYSGLYFSSVIPSSTFRPLRQWSRSNLVLRQLCNVNSDGLIISAPGNDVDTIETEEEMTDRHLRFSGVGRLYSTPLTSISAKRSNENEILHDQKLNITVTTEEPHLTVVDRLSASTVIIIGIGGVGSWAAEALCRSGIGNLVLIDMDDVCISNTNRQLHALSSTVGKSKIDVMKKRLEDINPTCRVTTIFDFISKDNIDNILDSALALNNNESNITVCIDAIDNQWEKTSTIATCAARGLPIVTCGGAAGRMDPTKIVCEDLTKAKEDRLLFWCRKRLRTNHGFPKGPANGMPNTHKVKKWNISAVYSTEVQKPAVEAQPSSSFRRCDGALGTACFVTGAYGFAAAGRVVDMIASGNVEIPKIPFQRKHYLSSSISKNANL